MRRVAEGCCACSVQVDITVNNILAIVNTKLLADYVSIDERLLQLCYVIKHWAKRRQVCPLQCPSVSFSWLGLHVEGELGSNLGLETFLSGQLRRHPWLADEITTGVPNHSCSMCDFAATYWKCTVIHKKHGGVLNMGMGEYVEAGGPACR